MEVEKHDVNTEPYWKKDIQLTLREGGSMIDNIEPVFHGEMAGLSPSPTRVKFGT